MTKEDKRRKGEYNPPGEPELSKVLHLGIPIPSRTPLNNPLPCKPRDMTSSPENETCEETSRRTKEQASQIERAWKGAKENQRTAGGAERESGEGSGQDWHDVGELRKRKGDERRRQPWPVGTSTTRMTEWPPTGRRHPLHERGSSHTWQARTAWSAWSHH